MIAKTYYILFLFLFIFLRQSFAQNFDRITLVDGLSQSNINCMIQDRLGFIWFGTNGGLNRYDGTEFKIYVHDLYDSNSISNNIINTIYEDDQGDLWIGTQNGLNVFRYKTNSFSLFKTDPNDPNSLSGNIITAIAKDSQGNYWIGTDGGGLNKLDPQSGKFIVFQNNIQNPYSISSNKITSLVVDQFGYIWAGTKDKGVNMIDPESGKCLRYVNNETAANTISNNQINTLYEDNEGDLWVGTANGLNLFTPSAKGRSFTRRDKITVFNKADSKNSLGGNAVLSIHQKNSGILWIGTDNGGLSGFNKKTRQFINHKFDPNHDNGLLSNKITALLNDKSGILWIGTNAGINKIDRQGDRFELYVRKPGTNNTWSSNNVQAIYKELNGIVWVGTFDAGLNKYNPHTGEFTIYKATDVLKDGISLNEHYNILSRNNKKASRYGKPDYLSNNRVLSLYRDLNRTLWIGTGGGGLNKLDLETEKVTVYHANPESPDSLSSNIITVIYEDSHGTLWLGTEGGGLNEFDRRKFRRYIHDENDVLSLSHNTVTSVTEDKKGNLWIGTYGGGLNKLNRDNGTFVRYTHEDKTGSISSNSVYSLYADDSSRLWIGTNDGLNLLDLNTGLFKHYTIHNNLPSNFIYGILGDQHGNLWLSTNKGISKFNIANEDSRNYDHTDGLQGQEFTPGALYQTKRGEMLFGGINGFNSFFPEEIKNNNFIPNVVITDFKLMGESVKIGAPDSPLQKHISLTDEIILSYKDKVLSFEFTALNYTNSEKNQYAYILENFEKKWNYVGNRRYANYTNLPPGEYTLKVKASNNDKVWNEEGTSLKIVVTPPFYQTWWFYVFAVVFVLSTAYLLILFRIRNLQRTKTMLREVVRARTRQLSEEKARVEKANSEITLQKNEIENQKNLLMTNNQELMDAKKLLDDANEELKAINANLEGIVLERTSKLRKANQKLLIANNELDLFIYRASHDLKGPIASLLGLTKIAKLEKLPPTTSDYIDKIETGAELLNKVLSKLTNIHFINKAELEPSDINIKSFIDGILRTFNPEKIRNFIVKNEISDDLTVVGDEKLLRIVFENLIENAIYFRKPGESLLLIKEEEKEDVYNLIFEDNGVGIPKEYQKKIFDMFYRASDLSKGSGLGLYLVKKVLEKVEGDITLFSEKGKFARFVISIPKEKVVQAAVASAETSDQSLVQSAT